MKDRPICLVGNRVRLARRGSSSLPPSRLHAPSIEGLARSEWPSADRVHESTTGTWNAPDASVHTQEHFSIRRSSASALKRAFTDAGHFHIMLARACERLAPATATAPHDLGVTRGAVQRPRAQPNLPSQLTIRKLHVPLCKSQSAWRRRTRLASSMVRHRRVFCPCLRNRIRQSGSACGTSGTCLSVPHWIRCVSSCACERGP